MFSVPLNPKLSPDQFDYFLNFLKKYKHLIYDVYFPGNGSYYVWISTRGNSYGNDTVSLSWNLNNTRTETLISSHAWNSEGQWEWEPEGINEPMNITISQPKIIQIIVTMREDGVEFDQLLITTNKDYDPDTED